MVLYTLLVLDILRPEVMALGNLVKKFKFILVYHTGSVWSCIHDSCLKFKSRQCSTSKQLLLGQFGLISLHALGPVGRNLMLVQFK